MRITLTKQNFCDNPLILGLILSGVLIFGLLMQEYLLGRFPMFFRTEWVLRDFRIAIVHCLLAGYLPGAYLYLVRGTRNTINQLDGVLIPGHQSSKVFSGLRIGKRALFFAALAGVLTTVFFSYLTAESPWDLSTWTPEVSWHRVLGPFIGWWFGWFVLAIWVMSARVSRLAARIGTVDLMDLSPLSPFVKQGLLTALLTVGLVSVCGLGLLDPEQGQWLVIASIIGFTLPLAALGLLLPVRGVYRRIRSAKQAELEWTCEKIRQTKTLLKSSSPEASHGRMADLLAYQQFIEDVPEWPLQGLSIVQVALYLLIPIVSWFSGLLIESVLDYIFG